MDALSMSGAAEFIAAERGTHLIRVIGKTNLQLVLPAPYGQVLERVNQCRRDGDGAYTLVAHN